MAASSSGTTWTAKRVYLFRRHRDNTQIVNSPDESLVLTGPSRGLLVFDGLFFEIDLKVRGDPQLDDPVFSKGMIHYNAVMTDAMLIKDKLTEMLSTIELKYAPVKRAVEATVEIRIFKAPEESSYLSVSAENEVSSLDEKRGLDKKFYGKITARTSGISEEIVLFDSEVPDTTITVEDDGLLKLRRQVISVPISKDLLLRLDTWDDDDGKANFCIGTLNFTPELCGEELAYVHHASYIMRVRVVWSALFVSKLDSELRRGVYFYCC